MSYFAKIEDGIVVQVIAIKKDVLDSGNWGDPDDWVQTSYNTRGGIHYAPDSNEPDGGVALRKNYAGIGYTYNSDKDAFISPKPFPSWNLNEETCVWEAPIEHPNDGKPYSWKEDTTSWEEIE